MHYRGFVFVSEPTEEAVEAVMMPHGGQEREGDQWDWYRCGGREDGYLQGDAEMDRRETHNGFNFDPVNKSAARNSCRVSELPTERRQIYFFVADGLWIARERWTGETFEDNAEFQAKLEHTITSHQQEWIVVVDAHN